MSKGEQDHMTCLYYQRLGMSPPFVALVYIRNLSDLNSMSHEEV